MVRQTNPMTTSMNKVRLLIFQICKLMFLVSSQSCQQWVKVNTDFENKKISSIADIKICLNGFWGLLQIWKRKISFTLKNESLAADDYGYQNGTNYMFSTIMFEALSTLQRIHKKTENWIFLNNS